MASDKNTLIRSIAGLADAIEATKSPKLRKELEAQRDSLLQVLNANAPDFEQGVTEPAPGYELPAKPAAPASDNDIPIQFAATNPAAPADVTEFVRGVRAREDAAAPPVALVPDAAHGTTQSGGNPLSAPLSYVPSQPGAAPVGYTPQNQEAPIPAQGGGGPVPGLSFDEYAQLARGGRGRGGVSVAGAAANATAAGAEARAAEQAQADAITKRAEAQARAGEAQGATLAGFIDQLRTQQAESASAFEQHKAQARELLAQSAEATQAFKDEVAQGGDTLGMSKAGNRIAAALSVALGAVGAGLTGGQNAGLAVLNMRIDTELRERAMKLQGAQAHLDAVDRLFKRNMELFGDEESARNATRSAMLGELELQVQRQAAVAGGEDKRNAAAELLAGIRAERARLNEANANKLYLDAQKRAAGGGKNLAQLYKDYLGVQKAELENQKLAGELSPKPGGGGDLGTVEGSRAAARKQEIAKAAAQYDPVLELGEQLLRNGVPDVSVRARDKYVPGGGLTLSDHDQEQLAALANLTRHMIRSVEGGRLSDADAEAARTELVRQGPTTSQAALTAQIRTLVNYARRAKARALAGDLPAAAAYEADKARALREAGPLDYSAPAGATQFGN